MRYLLISITLLFFIGCSTSENSGDGFTINATLEGVDDGTVVYLEVVGDNELTKLDSANIDNGSVEISGQVDYPQMAYLRIGESGNVINLFIENADIDIVSDINKLDETEVKGSSTHDDYVAFMAVTKPFEEESQKIIAEYREAAAKGDQEKVNEIMKVYEGLSDRQNEAIETFVKGNTNSFLAPFIIRRYLVFELDGDQITALLEPIAEEVHVSEDYKELAKRAEILNKVAIGQPAVDFALNDPEGNPISLSSFKGKYLLVDFWASWCRPCRIENPNVVKVYKDFKDKGFEILGVSFDEDRAKWLDAIQADQLTWMHVSDLKGWKSMAAGIYAVNSIPHTVLIDPDGIIIAKNLRGDALREKLAELIDS